MMGYYSLMFLFGSVVSDLGLYCLQNYPFGDLQTKMGKQSAVLCSISCQS